jgi:cytochrome c6
MLLKDFVQRLGLAAVTMTMLLAMFMTQSRTPAMATPVEDGATLFKAKCVACHGADASGKTPVGQKLGIKDLRSAEVQGKSDAQLSKIISDGKGKMPAYGKTLKAEQIHQLVAFIRSRKS